MAFIIKPLITEKMNNITEKSSVDRTYKPKTGKHRGEEVTKKAQAKYGFIVKPEANKVEIAKEIEALYNVTVEDVNTLRVTPGQRHKVIGTFEDITASVPEKSLVYGKRSTGGRNNTGKMTVRYMGGGHKKKYRLIDFKREKDGVPAVVKTIEYDPNRSARIALLYYADGEKRYIIAPNGLEVGATLMSGADAVPEVGNALPLANIPVGTVIHNIELRPGQGALLVRSAGNFAQLTSREGSYCVIKLPSGETRQVLSACKATIGSVGNSDHALEQSGKAGRSRWLGQRPHNRGVVMNPHDHPMGGGEGRQSGGHPRSRKGLYAKGLKTRAPKKLSNKYIIERANKK